MFIKKCVAAYEMLIELCWRHWKILSYIVAGDPTLAQMYLNWLVVADEGNSVEDYCFPSETIKLENHMSSNEAIEINTRECMDYLTEEADPKKILDDPIIKNNKNMLWKIARADEPVDLFDCNTWPTGIDFKPLVDDTQHDFSAHVSKSTNRKLCANACYCFKDKCQRGKTFCQSHVALRHYSAIQPGIRRGETIYH